MALEIPSKVVTATGLELTQLLGLWIDTQPFNQNG